MVTHENMSVSIFGVVILITLFYETGGAPRRSWGKFLEDSKELGGCPHNSQCVPSSKCPEHVKVETESESCANQHDDPWICCAVLQDLNFIPVIRTNSSNPTSDEISSEITLIDFESRVSDVEKLPFLAKPATLPLNANEKYTYENTIVKENDNLQDNNTLLAEKNPPLAEYRLYPNYRPWDRSHDYPSRSGWRENSGNNPSSKEYVGNNSPKSWNEHSSNSNGWANDRNWNKPSSSEARNKHSPDKYDYFYSDYSDSKLTNNPWGIDYNVDYPEKGVEYWNDKTTSRPYRKTTKSNWDRDYSSNSNRRSTQNSENVRTTTQKKRTTRPSWDVDYIPHSEKRTPVTRSDRTTTRPARNPTKDTWNKDYNASSDRKNTTTPAGRATNNSQRRPTEGSWNVGSNNDRKSTKVVASTTSHPRRKPISWGSYLTTSTTNRPNDRLTPYTTKTTAAYSRGGTPTKKTTARARTTATTTKRYWTSSETPIWGKSSTATSKRWATSKPSTSKATQANRRSSTNRYTTSTPMPNINIHMCGIRVSNSNTNRRRRSENIVNYPDSIVLHPESRNGDRSILGRIVGGQEAEPFSWPWVAALYRVANTGGNRFLCAGSLINENFVLTAAHVFTPNDLRSASYVVMLGTHTAKEAVAEYRVLSVLQHPEYQQRYYYNDIALLRLERPVVFNDYVMPVCLPSPSAPLLRDKELVGKKVTVMGWGDESYGGITSRVLREASFPIVSTNTCNASYIRVASNRFPNGLTANMLCAGDPNGGKDACQGDSGGPLTTFENGRYTQVGIVSFGYKCGDKEYPGVYTKVSRYLGWIAENARCDEFDKGPYYYYKR